MGSEDVQGETACGVQEKGLLPRGPRRADMAGHKGDESGEEVVFPGEEVDLRVGVELFGTEYGPAACGFGQGGGRRRGMPEDLPDIVPRLPEGAAQVGGDPPGAEQHDGEGGGGRFVVHGA